MSQIAKYGSKDQAWKAATALRKKLRNAEFMKSEATRRSTGVAFGAGVAGVAGFLMGQAESKAAAEGTLGGADDPTMLFGAPLPAVLGLGLAIGGFAVAQATEGKHRDSIMNYLPQLLEAGGAGLLSASSYEYFKKKGAEAA